MTQIPVISVSELTVTYGTVPVLHEISAEFAESRVTAIMGPSGCGKSTLLKVLNRTLEITPEARIARGTVRFRGLDMYSRESDPRRVRKRIGIVQQRPLPFPMSIKENVLFGVRFHRSANGSSYEDLAKAFLEKVGLWEEIKDRLHAPATRLSIGQQQRLCLARTLANQPEVILMDEPCSALDPASTARIEELIHTLKGEHTIIIVTHNLAQARRVSTDSVFLLDGKVAERGSTEKVLSNPDHPRVREIVFGREG